MTAALEGVSGQQHVPAALYPGKDPVPILQEAGWTPGPVWTGGKSHPHRDFFKLKYVYLNILTSVTMCIRINSDYKNKESLTDWTAV